MDSSDHPNEALPASLELTEALQRCREGIGAKLREASGMTEREVLAAGEALKLIVDEARAFALGSQQTLQEIATASITDMLERHRTLMTDFVEAMQAQVVIQSQAAQQATAQINRIVDLGRNIQHVTMESRMLALNANIQARRLGDAGRAFQVIGQEMKLFSESVSEANKGVQSLAEGLLDVLPRIENQAARARELSEQFSSDISRRVAEVAEANTQMKQIVADSMATAENRLQQILKLSYDALSHLQFQDPVAQTLLFCDREMGECLKRAGSWANGDDAADEKAANEGDVDDPALESGEVMML
jgi:methyl-accepting chemotaxis protein